MVLLLGLTLWFFPLGFLGSVTQGISVKGPRNMIYSIHQVMDVLLLEAEVL